MSMIHRAIVPIFAGLGLSLACATAACGDGTDTGTGGQTASGGSATGGESPGGSATGGGGTGGGTGGTTPASTSCEPMAAPMGNVVAVDPSMTAQLQQLVSSAQAGDTISFADGTYDLAGAYLWIATAGVTLRSQSGNPEAVILDGGYASTEIVTVAASNVTIAELTIRRPQTHGIHVIGTDGGDTTGTKIYRVHVEDPAEQAIKINANGAFTHFADDGEIACGTLILTDAGRPHVNPTATGCYTGGVDAHAARGWVIRDNHIEGFWCPGGLSEHAVHFWRGGRDTVVERNVMVDVARGVGFGLADSGTARTYADDPCPAAAGGYVDHYGGVVRNNFIVGKRAELFTSSTGFDSGVAFWSSCGAAAYHNSVVATGDLFSSIEWRFATSTGVQIANNLVTHPLRERDGASGTQSGNVDTADAAMFVSVAGADLHLAAGATAAIDMGAALPAGACDGDFDGEPRIGARDVGADEMQP